MVRRFGLFLLAFALMCIIGNVISISLTRTITNTGRIRTMGLDVWQDSAGTIPLLSINWGSVPPGAIKQYIGYIQNVNETLLSLHMNISAWSPLNATSYLTCFWNATNALVSPGAILPVQFELTTTNDAPRGTVFSFNINIWPESAE
jgi:hypothetical protein